MHFPHCVASAKSRIFGYTEVEPLNSASVFRL